MDIRTGLGYDIHRLKEGNHLLLGGVLVPGTVAIDAHSDGDIVLHALSQAIFSSLGLEDIGSYFPDNLQSSLNLDSKKILSLALEKMNEKGYQLGNVTVAVILQRPKLKDYKRLIKSSLSHLLSLDEDRIAVHANTKEGVGEVGEGKAIEVLAEVLIKKD